MICIQPPVGLAIGIASTPLESDRTRRRRNRVPSTNPDSTWDWLSLDCSGNESKWGDPLSTDGAAFIPLRDGKHLDVIVLDAKTGWRLRWSSDALLVVVGVGRIPRVGDF